jgi:glycerol-3-phosphate acyltransferase PlsY
VNALSITELLVVSYLLGSIPFSFLIVKLRSGSDIRTLGSGNVGATNAARAAGKLAGVLALVLDAAKGYAAVMFAQWLIAQRGIVPIPGDMSPMHSRAFWLGLAGVVAMLGHMFPIWLNFHGGKGVATAAGVFLAIDPLASAGGAIVFLIAVLLSRFVSLGSMAAAAAMPLLLRFMTHAPFWIVVFSIVISFAVIAKHHTNIARLAGGRERPAGSGKGDD